MEKRSKFLTFILACIPGVGHMYLGLVRKGTEILLSFIVLNMILRIIGFQFLSIPIWFYFFFDTFRIANMIDRGEILEDGPFVSQKFNSTNGMNLNDLTRKVSNTINTKSWVIIGWGLVVLGGIVILNRALAYTRYYYLIREYSRNYLTPIIFILLGVYILIKSIKKSKQ